MFTGIIEDVGDVVAVEDAGSFRRLTIRAPHALTGATRGDSIAVNGVCITAVDVSGDTFAAELSRETLDRTTFGAITTGSRVNLERSMRADSRFGGHIVQGHVDGVGRIESFDRHGDDWMLRVAYPPEFRSRLVWKGSIAIDGISLTVAERTDDAIAIAIIPYTLEHTNLADRRPGDAVNLEFDVLAKYVENLVGPYLEQLGKGLG